MMRAVAAGVMVLSLASAPALAGPMRAGERQRLLAHLDMTGSWLADETSGLTADQLAFRTSPDSWSILEVVEHLVVAEPQYWQQLQESLRTAAGDVKPEATDAAILWYGIDRTNRARTGEARTPKGRYSELGPALAEFRRLRASMREYASATEDDLRGRMLKDGNMDVYQWFLMISSHSQRHILQIREIKADARFPAKGGSGGSGATGP